MGLVAAISAMMLFTLFTGSTDAQEQKSVPQTLKVGTIKLPPFAMKDSNGVWIGVGIDLLHMAARELHTTIKIREFDNASDLKEALSKGEVDLSPCARISEDLEIEADFSNPYHRSGSAIATMIADDSHAWGRVAKVLFSIYSHKLISILMISWIIAGTLVWLFEKNRNSDVFGKRMVKGVGNGIWWASVTMTTVGYGDKAPKTIGGRMVAIIWMFCSILMISAFTATIASSLAAGEIKGKVRSYHNLFTSRVGAMDSSYTITHLGRTGVTARPFNSVQEGLKAVAENSIDAFITDEGILRYLVMTEYPDQLYVLDKTFDHYFLGMALPPHSDLREPLNRALLKIMADEKWKNNLKRYLSF